MKQNLLIFAFSLISTMLFSQSQPMAFEDWKSTDGTQNFFYKNVTKTDASSNVYVAGATTTGNGTTDILLTKKNSSGVTLWTKTYNGAANFHDFATSLNIDASGNVYLTGAVSNNTVTYTQDLIVIKYNSSGTQQWLSTYDGGYGSDVGKDIILNPNGEIFITGSTYNSSGNADFLTIHYNTSGVQQWVSTYGYSSGMDDGAVKIQAKTTTNCTITGMVTISANNYKAVSIQYDATNGSTVSVTTSTATVTSSVEAVSDMVTDASNNIYISGAVSVSGQGFNYCIIKLTSTLVLAWQQTYNSSDNLNDVAKGLQVDGSGNVYVTGYSTSSTQGKNFTTIKYNSSGTQQWVQSYNGALNGDDEAADLVLDASNNVYVTGSTPSDLNNLDYFTIKYNSSGTKLWDIQSDANHLNDQATNLALDSLNSVIVTGVSETAPNNYEYTTYRYIQRDVIVPIDLNNEPKNQFLSFTPNLGQLHDENSIQNTNIKFYNTTISPAIFIKKNLNSFMFIKNDTTSIDSTYRFDLSFPESNTNAKPYPIEPVNEKQNFYTSNLPSAGLTNVAANNRLFVPDVYPNIDLHYYSNSDGIKYYFVVKPGGNPNSITMHFDGCVTSHTNASNQLIVKAPWDSLSFKTPQIYQLNSGATVTVSGTPLWNSIGSNSYRFTLPSYNADLPLVIMISKVASPANTAQTGAWRTYLGSYGSDVAQDVVTDDLANVYVSGYTEDIILYQSNTGNNALSGFRDAMVVKFDKDAHWVWSHIYGGSIKEEFRSLTFSNYNGVRSIYLTGSTGSNIIKAAITPSLNPNDGTHWDELMQGAADALIVRLEPVFGTIIYSQYIGGCNDDRGMSIAADNVRGRVYITGTVDDYFPCPPNVDFPLKNPGGNSYYTSQHSNPGGSNKDVFIFAIDLNNVVLYSTYIGGDKSDYVEEIAVNQSTGDFYITGSTSSLYSVRTSGGPYIALNDTSFPLGKSIGGYWQPAKATSAVLSSYISKFNQNYELHWSTFFNGDGTGKGTGLDVAPNGDLYATGVSYSTKSSTVNCGVPNDDGFPVCNPFQSAAYGGAGSDIYLARFNSSNAMTYSTLYGNDDDENPASVGQTYPKLCVEKNNNVFVTGATQRWGTSNAFPVLNKTGLYYQASNGTSPSSNAFILWFDASNQRTWASHYGGATTGSETGNSVAIFGSTQLYMVGQAGTYSLPLACPPTVGAPPYCKTNNSNSQDAFLARFDMGTFIGIEEYKDLNTNNTLFVYPNPSNTNINITFKGRELDNYSLEIYNMLGQAVYKKDLGKTFGQHTEIVNVSSYGAGMYIINLVSTKEILSTKIIKQ